MIRRDAGSDDSRVLVLTVAPCAAAEALRVTLKVLTQISRCEGLDRCGRSQGCLAEQKFSLESIETETCTAKVHARAETYSISTLLVANRCQYPARCRAKSGRRPAGVSASPANSTGRAVANPPSQRLNSRGKCAYQRTGMDECAAMDGVGSARMAERQGVPLMVNFELFRWIMVYASNTYSPVSGIS